MLVAFRLLVCWLEERGFSRRPGWISKTLRRPTPSPELGPLLYMLLHTPGAQFTDAFADLVGGHLGSVDDQRVGKLASAIDTEFGGTLSGNLRSDDRSETRTVARAVNVANRVLMQGPCLQKPMVLVKSPLRYWRQHPDVVPPFPGGLQNLSNAFGNLLPLRTEFNRVDYSVVFGDREISVLDQVVPPRLCVALWPDKAPSLDSGAITKGRETENHDVSFYFAPWELLGEVQARHTGLAERIAAYIRAAPDDPGTIHIAAAPELTMAPQSHQCIIEAIATRRYAAWIAFPGTYHIVSDGNVTNRGSIYVGGALRQKDLNCAPGSGPISAIKGTAVEIPDGKVTYFEDIEGAECSVHVLDCRAGRIAVMICRDFLDDDLRNQVVSMGIDHLFVLSMSRDSGFKFETAMDSASNYGTGCFLVNAYTEEAPDAAYSGPPKRPREAAHRAPLRDPLKGHRDPWVHPAADGLPYVFESEPPAKGQPK